jgi:hypothetical protein
VAKQQLLQGLLWAVMLLVVVVVVVVVMYRTVQMLLCWCCRQGARGKGTLSMMEWW